MFVRVSKLGENSMCPGRNLRCSSCNEMADIVSLFVEIRDLFLAIKIHVVF